MPSAPRISYAGTEAPQGRNLMMNVHHLELFYYVARHGGVSAAARQIPYGIQQPAISAQILQLEDTLGVTLFRRRPFQLTREGQTMYEFIAPFFSRLEEVSHQIRGTGESRLRIAAPEIVQREYVPDLLTRMRKRVPGFHFTLTHGRQQDIEHLLQAQEVDVGIAVITKPESGVQVRELARLSLVLLVPERSRIQQASEVLERDRIDLPLVTLSQADGVSRAFQAGLRERGLDWVPSLELGGLDLVARYVAEGFGVGVSLHLPGVSQPAGVRELPLRGFPELAVGALWTGRLSPLGEVFVEVAQGLAQELFARRTP